jgi:hypothetical protein
VDRLITFQDQSVALRPGYPPLSPLADTAYRAARSRNYGV